VNKDDFTFACWILSMRRWRMPVVFGDKQTSDGRQIFPRFPVGVGSHKGFL